jgi:hypothetical protein
MEMFDVTVIGAGLAGLELTKELSARGLSVLLVDRKSDLSQHVHTTGIFVRKTLEDFDLPAHCLGDVVRQVKLYSPARQCLTLESPHDEFRVGRMGKLYTHLLEQSQNLGAVFSSGTHFLGSSKAANGSVLHFSRDGQDFTAKTRFLVGADGAISRVAQDLKLEQNKEFIVGVEDVLEGCHWLANHVLKSISSQNLRLGTSPGSSTMANMCIWERAVIRINLTQPLPSRHSAKALQPNLISVALHYSSDVVDEFLLVEFSKTSVTNVACCWVMPRVQFRH